MDFEDLYDDQYNKDYRNVSLNSHYEPPNMFVSEGGSNYGRKMYFKFDYDKMVTIKKLTSNIDIMVCPTEIVNIP